MRLLDLLRRIYVQIEMSHRDQGIKNDMVAEIKEFVSLYEKGKRWCEINKTLGMKYYPREIKKDSLLPILRRHNEKLNLFLQDIERRERKC